MTCARCIIRWPATHTVDGEPVCADHAEAAVRALTPGAALVIAALTHEARVAPLPPAPKEVPA